MPNGGPTPSCLYCKWFVMESRRCAYHNFALGVSIPRILCSEMKDEEAPDWVESKVDLKTFTPEMLYIWLEIAYTDPHGNHGHAFNLHPFASIADYTSWSEDQEAEVLGKLHEAQRLLYKKQGYTNVE
jgi:hypothetical protein